MKIIYIDSLFVINLLADYTLLVTAARSAGAAPRRVRCFAAAVFGALCAVLSVVRGFYFLASPLLRLPMAWVLGLIAYGADKAAIRCTAVFLAVSASFGGAIFALGLRSVSLGVLAVCFAVCYAGLTMIALWRGKLPTRTDAEVRLRFMRHECSLRALVDSGNCLTDPLSGADVMIVEAEALRPLLGAAAVILEIDDPVEFISSADLFPELSGKFRLLPYTALGGTGLMPVFRPERVTVDGKERGALLCAVAHEPLAEGFDAIIGI